MSAAIDGLGPASERPLLNPSADLAAARLTPTEAFVLSRVDGKTSYEEICEISGMGRDATIQILQKLRRERLLLHPGEKVDPPRPKPAAPPASSGFDKSRSHSRAGIPRAPTSLLEIHDDGSPVDPLQLAQGPELDVETKTRIVRLHRRCKSLKPHELLGLPAGADLAQIKRAYFAASKEIHPDRYFGKDIGPFRGLLSDIFTQLTRAFDQLKK